MLYHRQIKIKTAANLSLRSLRQLIAVTLFFSIASIAEAKDKTVNDLSYVIANENNFVLGIVFGMGEGIVAHNTYMNVKGFPSTFCRPKDMAFNPKEYYSLLQAYYIQTGRAEVATSIALVLALEKTFPCN